MNTKLFVGIFLTLLLVASASALTLSSSNSLSDNKNSTTITLTNNQLVSQNITLSIADIIDGSEKVVLALSSGSILNLPAGNSTTFTVTATSITDDFSLGEHATTLQALGTNSSANLTIKYVKEFCEEGNVNATEIKISSIEDTTSDDEWEWKPRDSVEIDVKVKNQLDDDEDFVVELGIYDTDNNEFVEINDEDTLEQEISIDEGDSEKITFAFNVPLDLEKSNGRYLVYIKAYVDGDEEVVCNSGAAKDFDSSVKSLKIDRNNNDVVIDEIEAPELVTAGETITVSAKAFNIGETDEKKVKVVLKNTALGISEESSAFRLDQDDSETVNFEITIPATAKDGSYALALTTLFKYDSSRDLYKDSSDDTWTAYIKVSGGVPITNATSKVAVGITASLVSGAEAGETLEVKSTITNPGTAAATFVVDAKDYGSWATLNSVSERIFALAPGQSKDVTFKFDVNDGAAGAQTFTIETLSNGKSSTKQVAVTIAESAGFDISSLFKGNSLIYVIAAVNIVLILLIILVVIRIARR